MQVSATLQFEQLRRYHTSTTLQPDHIRRGDNSKVLVLIGETHRL